MASLAEAVERLTQELLRRDLRFVVSEPACRQCGASAGHVLDVATALELATEAATGGDGDVGWPTVDERLGEQLEGRDLH